MTDQNLPDYFNAKAPDPQLTVYAMMADISAMRASSMNAERRFDVIEKAVGKNEELLRALLDVQAKATANERNIAELKVRCETIDRNVDALSDHNIRIKKLEEDLIKNGELRMSNLEKTRSAIFGIIGTAALPALGWLFATFVLPLLKHG